MFDKIEILRRLQEHYEGAVQVDLVEVNKGYGVLEAYQLREVGANIGVNLYINDLSHIEDDTEAFKELVRIYEHKAECSEVERNITSVVMDFQKVRSNIFSRLINSARAGEFLEDKPHRGFADDLAIMYYLSLEEGNATVSVTNGLADMWGVCEADLYEIAAENATPVVSDMIDWVKCGGVDLEEMRGQMFILSNCNVGQSNEYGAGMLPLMLEKLHERFGTCIIIPSSVHEVILIPEGSAVFTDDMEALSGIINFVNVEKVSDRDFLSDHPYVWDGLELAAV